MVYPGTSGENSRLTFRHVLDGLLIGVDTSEWRKWVGPMECTEVLLMKEHYGGVLILDGLSGGVTE